MAALVHCTFVIPDHEVLKNKQITCSALVTPVHILHIPLLYVIRRR